jgi:hypothetical protein
MKSKTIKLVGIVVGLIFVGRILQAQPDLGVVGKADNPANRNRAQPAAKENKKVDAQKLLDKLAEREAEREEQRLERMPKYLSTYGVADAKTQSAILAHLKRTSVERQEVAKAQYMLRRLLVLKNTIEAQIKEASDALRKAEKDYEVAFEKSLVKLDQEIAYKKNARLEAALLALGALDAKGIIGPS